METDMIYFCRILLCLGELKEIRMRAVPQVWHL
jgi:hypothetical protein